MSESLRSKREESCKGRCGVGCSQSVPEERGFGVLGQGVSEERTVGVIIMERDGEGESRRLPNHAWIAHTRPTIRNMQSVYDVLTCKFLASTGIQVCKSMMPVGQGSREASRQGGRTRRFREGAIKRVEICRVEERLGVESAILVWSCEIQWHQTRS